MDYKITEEQAYEWGYSVLFPRGHCASWLADILNGDYPVAEARRDCLGVTDINQRRREDGLTEEEDND